MGEINFPCPCSLDNELLILVSMLSRIPWKALVHERYIASVCITPNRPPEALTCRQRCEKILYWLRGISKVNEKCKTFLFLSLGLLLRPSLRYIAALNVINSCRLYTTLVTTRKKSTEVCLSQIKYAINSTERGIWNRFINPQEIKITKEISLISLSFLWEDSEIRWRPNGDFCFSHLEILRRKSRQRWAVEWILTL